MRAWCELDSRAIAFVDKNGRVMHGVHGYAVVLCNIIEGQNVCDPFGIVPNRIWVVPKVALLCQLDASCITTHPDGVGDIVNVSEEICIGKDVGG